MNENNNEIIQNVKVYARFRPFNKMEDEINKNGLGKNIVLFPDENSVILEHEPIIYKMDRTFT